MEMARFHEIKCLPEYFEETASGRKGFELRNNDRGYAVGDLLAMNEHDGQKYTGRALLLKVDYMMDPNEVMTCADGFVLMGVHPVPIEDEARCFPPDWILKDGERKCDVVF